jgi:hypothetical protein
MNLFSLSTFRSSPTWQVQCGLTATVQPFFIFYQHVGPAGPKDALPE